MKLVEQKEPYGCTVACLAMVLGATYEDVQSQFINDFTKRAISFKQVLDYLGENGFSVLHKEAKCYNDRHLFRDELFRPFAPVHIVHVRPRADMKSSHVVVMDQKGKIFCPGGHTEDEIRNAYEVTDTVGLYK